MGELKQVNQLAHALDFEHAKQIVGDLLEAATTTQEMIVCATFDVDYLSDINEKFSWAAGDAVLSHLIELCRIYSDIVTRHDDEISVVWKGCTVEQGVKHATDLFQHIQTSEFEFEGVHIPVSVSMGITHNHEGEVLSFSELVSPAVTAMAKCKNLGRNRFILDVAPYM